MPFVDILRGRWEGGREVWSAVRGGAAEIARWEHDSFGLETEWSMEEGRTKHVLECEVRPQPHLRREKLAADGEGQYLFDTHARTLGSGAGLAEGGATNVGLKGTGGGRNPRATYSSSRSLLGQIERVDRMAPVVLRRLRSMQQAMRGTLFLDINPRLMRDYSPISPFQEMGAQGEFISSTVWMLCQEEEKKLELIDWLSELCAPTIRDIDFIETDLGDVMLSLVEGDGTRVSARSLSDGTLRFLGELTALLTAPRGSVVLIEEIENGLHPARVHLLVQLLDALKKKRQIQVIATTHSPKVLEAVALVSPETLREAVVFGRPKDAEGTIARKLGELRAFEEVLERRGIDQLFTTKWLERAL